MLPITNLDISEFNAMRDPSYTLRTKYEKLVLITKYNPDKDTYITTCTEYSDLSTEDKSSPYKAEKDFIELVKDQ